jgi:hypothetical protein
MSATRQDYRTIEHVDSVACRLFVYLAREAPKAVVLRRGPTDWARLSLWHTDTDTFEHGQWIKGRVYERRSDVSADGALFCGFVRQSGGRPDHRVDTWIAVSRPPYFSALAVWFIGGTYHTGGFFPARSALWLGFMSERPPDVGHLPAWLRIVEPKAIGYIDGTSEWTDRTVHFNRLLRDGWELDARHPYQTLWRRRHPTSPLVLHMAHSYEDSRKFGGPYTVEYTVWDEALHREHVLGAATWADWDQKGRLLLARDGKLMSWQPGLGTTRMIADLNDHEPDPQPAPADATIWPDASS